ncbi:hypothetical protein COO60DRAFT_1555937 [Scenedesmus sp. NREL 46B-D3]|nr:hypothetical protein COO60DRAFT_1555937 [Scenedesmus sp. NREL 46B-D3]
MRVLFICRAGAMQATHACSLHNMHCTHSPSCRLLSIAGVVGDTHRTKDSCNIHTISRQAGNLPASAVKANQVNLAQSTIYAMHIAAKSVYSHGWDGH